MEASIAMTTDGHESQSATAPSARALAEAAPERAGAPVKLSLLGNYTLSIDGKTVTFGAGAQRLLMLLALNGPQRRTYLAGTLWPDTSDDLALTRLRSTLWRLRRQVSDLLDTSEQTIALSAAVEVDVEHLVAVCRELIERFVGPDRLTACFKVLVQARELLLGCYDDWVLQARERLTNLRLHALEILVEELIAARRHPEAVEAAIAAVQLDPLRESTHRALMRAYLAEGNPASARCELEHYRSLLRSELGIDEPTSLMLELVGPVLPASVSRGPAFPAPRSVPSGGWAR